MRKFLGAVVVLLVYTSSMFGQAPWPPPPCDTTYCNESWSGLSETVVYLPGGCTIVVGYQTRHCPDLQVAIVYVQPTGCGGYSAHDLSVYMMQQLLAIQGRAIPRDTCWQITLKRYACFEIDTILDPWGGITFAPWFVSCNDGCCTINCTVCKYNDTTYFIHAHHSSGVMTCDTNPMFPGPCTFGCDTVGLTNIVNLYSSMTKRYDESSALDIKKYAAEHRRFLPRAVTSDDVVHVQIDAGGDFMVTMYDSHGNMLRKSLEHLASGQHDVRLPVQGLPSGVYEVMVVGERQTIYRRVVIP